MVTTVSHTQQAVRNRIDSPRVVGLRQRVREAMAQPVQTVDCPPAIAAAFMDEPLPVRKGRAIAAKLAHLPVGLWPGQLIAGSLIGESPRLHMPGFPEYTTEAERQLARERGLGFGAFGHIVPDYPRLLAKGLNGILADVEAQRPQARNEAETAFLDSVAVTLQGVIAFAARLADSCLAAAEANSLRRVELTQMASNLRQVPAGPAQTFWQALQSIWLVHLSLQAARNGNAMGRVDQYAWPFLQADLAADRIDLPFAAELVDCFCLKFNERAHALPHQATASREAEQPDPNRRSRHTNSSQIATRRDSLDATNHWLQNVIIGGRTPTGEDGTNPLTFLLLDSCRRNQMTNPVLNVRVSQDSPTDLLREVCESLKDGGGMPAMFNDETIVPALEKLGIPRADALDYTNDGCWEVIIPGRTDFHFERLSLMLCLEWTLNHGRGRIDERQRGIDTGDARGFLSFDQLWDAFARQVDHMVGRAVQQVMAAKDDRSIVAPVPLLSALIDGALRSRTDLTAGGAKYRTRGMLAESAAYAIDSLVAIRTVVFEQGQASMAEVCEALAADYVGHEPLRAKLLAAPKYGNDDDRADTLGQAVIALFVDTVEKHARGHQAELLFPCGVGTFSWYVGIGQGLGASPDGRRSGQPVSSNFSPSLGSDRQGLPGALLSYAKMHQDRLPAGGPLDLRVAGRLVRGQEGTDRMVGLIRSLSEIGGTVVTLTVADTDVLRRAQEAPEQYRSLRVRMGGWCAYFTMLSPEQQEVQIRREEALNG